MSKYKLHTASYGSNLHETATIINKQGWAEYVVVMDYDSGYTLVVFKMPAELVYKIRRDRPNYKSDPHHDDPKTEEAT